MKKLHLIFLALIVLSAACKKDDSSIKQFPASLNIINAVVDLTPVRINAGATTAFSFARATDLAYGTHLSYGTSIGMQAVKVVRTADTTTAIFAGSLSLGSINTLYLAGQYPTVDTIFREERNIPVIDAFKVKADSSIYVRFVNLSPNSSAVNINIRSTAGNEVSSLGYKGISTFKKYEAKAQPNYIFEVRDAVTSVLLTTYTLAVPANRHKTISLILKGSMGITSGTNAFGVFQVNYF